MQARVGRVADTYRGTFAVTDVQDGAELRVRVRAGGRFGRIVLDLYVTLLRTAAGETSLRYDADAAVGGVVSRLGSPALSVAGGHLTGSFFRDLESALSTRRTSRPLASL